MFSYTRYSQQDPQWRDLRLGFDPSATIGSQGCLLTDLAMAVTGFGFNETPATLTQKLVGLGPNAGFIGALVVPAALPRVLPGIIYRDFVDCAQTPAPMDRIDAALVAGWPVIVEVDYSPAAGLQNHWVMLVGYKSSDYLLQDPWPIPPDAAPLPLSHSRYAFAGTPSQTILAVVFLEGPRPPVNKPDKAVSVYVTEEGLALRSAGVIDPANLIKRLMKGSELYSLESVDVTLQKVGAVNQWLNIQDTSGAQGFVAAWYLSTRKEQPTPIPVNPPVGQPLVVYGTVDQLALRTQPVVDPATLIKRVGLGTAFTVTEPVEQAQGKVGVVNAWLQVTDPTGAAGYVAAWYVSLTVPVGLGPTTSGPGPGTIPPASGPASPANLTVITTVPSLALRSKPVISPDTLIKRFPAGTELTVSEPADAALTKIGTNNQWLQVTDADHTSGYVAAWYVKKSGG